MLKTTVNSASWGDPPTTHAGYRSATPGLFVYKAEKDWQVLHGPSMLDLGAPMARRKDAQALAELLGEDGRDWTTDRMAVVKYYHITVEILDKFFEWKLKGGFVLKEAS